jgi:hypothetical protein
MDGLLPEFVPELAMYTPLGRSAKAADLILTRMVEAGESAVNAESDTG